MYSALSCHIVVKYTESYLGKLLFDVTSNGNAECFKNSYTMEFKMLLCETT
jgi:hypothetical protein